MVEDLSILNILHVVQRNFYYRFSNNYKVNALELLEKLLTRNVCLLVIVDYGSNIKDSIEFLIVLLHHQMVKRMIQNKPLSLEP